MEYDRTFLFPQKTRRPETLLVQDGTLPVLSMKNVPALHHHLVPDTPVVPAIIRARIELPVHETRRQGEV